LAIETVKGRSLANTTKAKRGDISLSKVSVRKPAELPAVAVELEVALEKFSGGSGFPRLQPSGLPDV
jgi:hypothetical protein